MSDRTLLVERTFPHANTYFVLFNLEKDKRLIICWMKTTAISYNNHYLFIVCLHTHTHTPCVFMFRNFFVQNNTHTHTHTLLR